MQILQKDLDFLDNCIWIVCVKFSFKLWENLSPEFDLLTNSPSD